MGNLETMTAAELRNLWTALMVEAKAVGLNTRTLKFYAIEATQDVPAESKAIYTTRELIALITSELAVWTKTGRKVWETGHGGDRNLVAEGSYDLTAGDALVARAFAAVGR